MEIYAINMNELVEITDEMCDDFINKKGNLNKDIIKDEYDRFSYMSGPTYRDTLDKYEDVVHDIFLSHTTKDKAIIKKLYYYLEVYCKLKVYVDWIIDPFLNRSNVTKKSVRLIEIRLRQSKSILLCKTIKYRSSRWIMWEIGYFAGYKNTNMAQINLGKTSTAKLEFLLSCSNAYLEDKRLLIVSDDKKTIDWYHWAK